jgi:hypothetical protein
MATPRKTPEGDGFFPTVLLKNNRAVATCNRFGDDETTESTGNEHPLMASKASCREQGRE